MKNVLLVLAGWVHPPFRGRKLLAQALGELSGFSFDEVRSLAQATQRSLADYDALVLYYHHMNTVLQDDELAAFDSYVRDGGGVLAVHSATASYKPTRGYFEVLGGRFTGHGPVQRIDIRPSKADDPIFGGIAPFAVKDELYLHELWPDIDVHFETTHDGKTEPMVWTRHVGQGRVCYTCPGHRAASLENESVQEIARRGLRWVARDTN